MALSKLRQKEEELNEREKILNNKELDLELKEKELQDLQEQISKGGSISVSLPSTSSAPSNPSVAPTDPSKIKKVKLDVGNFKIANYDITLKRKLGGKIISTSIATLTSQSSQLSALFSGGSTIQPDSDGTYLIDRDPEYFHYILEWLRTSEVPQLKKGHKWARVVKEAEYWRLDRFPKGYLADIKKLPFKHSLHKEIPKGNMPPNHFFLESRTLNEFYLINKEDFFTAAPTSQIALRFDTRETYVWIYVNKVCQLYNVHGMISVAECLLNGFTEVGNMLVIQN